MRRRTLLWTAATGLTLATPLGAVIARPSRLDHDPFHYGARGDGVSDDRAAIQRAIDACAAQGGGRVVLSPGRVFLSGGLELKSNVELYLAAGATLKASSERASYGDRGALIFARRATNCGVTGPGRMDGNFRAFLTPRAGGGFEPAYTFLGRYDPERAFTGASRPDGRPRMMLFVECRRLSLSDFQIADAPSWTIHLLGCHDVSVISIGIANNITVPNCDGIDVDCCSRVRILGCDIRAGDDGICFKTSARFRELGPCQDITVSGCTITSASSAIKFGSAAANPIRNVVITGCTISDSNRGVAMQNRDGSSYENVIFSNLVIGTRYYPPEWWGAAEPIHLSNLPRVLHQKSAGTIRGISFSAIRCVGESGAYLYGAPGSPIEDISFDDVDITIAKTGPQPGGFYDLRPAAGHPAVEPGQIAGIHAEGVNGLALSDVAVHFRAPIDPSYGPALFTRRVNELDIAGFRGGAAHAGAVDRVEA